MFSFNQHSRSASKRRLQARNKASYTRLEDRKMLAAFTGTEDGDVVTITITDGQPTSVEINGTLHENPDATLELDLLNGFDEIHFNGSQNFDLKSEETTFLTINENIFVDSLNVLTIRTGDGADRVNIEGKFNATLLSVETEGGDDVVNLNGASIYGIGLGDGNDRIVGLAGSDSVGFAIGGDGLDTQEGWNQLSNFGIGEFHQIASGSGAPFSAEFEKYVASEVGGIIQSPGDLLVIGQQTWLYRTDSDENPIQLVNFNRFEGNYDQNNEAGETIRLVHIHETAYPITVKGGYVNIGGDFRAGDTSGIQHPVTLEDTNVLLVTDSASSNFHNVSVSKANNDFYAISGLTPVGSSIFTKNVAHVNLASSNTENDAFSIDQTSSHLILFGNGGDDLFQIANFSDRLSNIGNVVNIVGGEGNDFIKLSDQGDVESSKRFRVSSNWVFTTGDSQDQRFQGVSHSGVERLHLIANELADRFYVSPSSETQFTITGGKLDLPITQLYQLIPSSFGNPQVLDLGNDEFSWYFGEVTKFIHLRHHSN